MPRIFRPSRLIASLNLGLDRFGRNSVPANSSLIFEKTQVDQLQSRSMVWVVRAPLVLSGPATQLTQKDLRNQAQINLRDSLLSRLPESIKAPRSRCR